MMNRRFTKYLLAAFLLAILLASGCQREHNTTPDTPSLDQPDPALEVRVEDSPGARTIDAATAQRLIEQRNTPSNTPSSAYDTILHSSPSGRGWPEGPGESPSDQARDPIASSHKERVNPQPREVASFPQYTHQPVLAEPNLAPSPLPDCLAKLRNAPNAEETIVVNFNQADIHFVIESVSEITGINFIVDDSIAGNVTVLSPANIRVAELYDFLESILEVKGYAAVPANDHVKIVPRAQANQRNLRIRVGANPDDIPRNDAIVTQIIPLQYADASEVSSIIQPRLSPSAQLSAYPRTNTLLLTDTSANIHNVARIIQTLDVPGAQEEWTVIPLRYASAQIISKQILDIMRQDANPRLTQTRSPERLQTRLQVQPDTRTNSLIVIASAQDTRVIRNLVEELDVERPAGVENMYVVYLRNALAEEMAEALALSLANLPADQALVNPGIHITPDVGTNALIINASPPDYKVISDIIAKLDIVREQVLVELLIVEVSEDDLLEIGVDWATLEEAVSDSIRVFGSTNFGIRASVSDGTFDGLAVGAWKSIDGDTQIGSILGALERVSGVDILSTPHVLTSNHREAHILVGNNIPFITQSRITETDPATPTVIQTIDYKDVGVEMNITPHISQGGLVRLAIDSSFTQVIESVTGLGPETPTTATRKLTTEIAMPEGNTVIIGGLIRDDIITTEKKIPFLGDIPLLGNLFKYQRNRNEKTNLLLFITPYVLTTDYELQAITTQKRNQTAHPDAAYFRTDKFTPRKPVSPRQSSNDF